MGRLSTVLLWAQTHPLVVTGMLVVSLLLAGVYAIVIFMAIARMDADYFMRSEADRDSWRIGTLAYGWSFASPRIWSGCFWYCLVWLCWYCQDRAF